MPHRFKELLLFIFLLLKVVAVCHAQEQNKKFSIQLSPGLAIPVGKFGKKVYSFHPDSSYGLAKPGPQLSLKLSYHLNRNFVLSFLAEGMMNKEDKKALQPAVPLPGVQYFITVNNWKTLALMFGAGYELNLNKSEKQIRLVPSIHIGTVKTGFPGDGVFYTDGNLVGITGSYYREKFPMQWALCYQLGAALKIPLSDTWFISSGGSFFSTSKLKSAKYKSDPRHFQISTLNISAGIGVNL